MAQISWPEAPERIVTDTQVEQMGLAYVGNGIVGSPSDSPVVYADGTEMKVRIRANKLGVVGNHYWLSGTSEYTETIDANISGSTRIDSIVLRLTRSPDWKVRTAVKKGTAGSGQPPALTQDAVGQSEGTYEIRLANVTVPNAAGVITAGNVSNQTLYIGPNAAGSRMIIDGANGTLEGYDTNGVLVSNIDGTGHASFKSLSISSDDLVVDGTNISDYITGGGSRLVAYGADPGWPERDLPTVPGTDPDAPFQLVMELAVPAQAGRAYRVTGKVLALKNSGATLNSFFYEIRDAGSSAPVSRNGTYITGLDDAGDHVTGWHEFSADNVSLPSGTRRLYLAVQAYGSGTYVVNDCSIAVYDCGPSVQNTGVDLRTGAPTPPSTPPQTYTSTHICTWSGSYSPAGNYGTFGGSTRAYQGDANEGSGNRKSAIGFDWATIQSQLSGATVTSCKVTLYYQHWWFNAGGTAIIGTHNYAGGSAPSTYAPLGAVTNRVQSSNWPRAASRTVELGTGIGNEFKNGTSKGIVLGPGPTSSTTYYGYASGFGAVNAASITFQYTK